MKWPIRNLFLFLPQSHNTMLEKLQLRKNKILQVLGDIKGIDFSPASSLNMGFLGYNNAAKHLPAWWGLSHH